MNVKISYNKFRYRVIAAKLRFTKRTRTMLCGKRAREPLLLRDMTNNYIADQKTSFTDESKTNTIFTMLISNKKKHLSLMSNMPTDSNRLQKLYIQTLPHLNFAFRI